MDPYVELEPVIVVLRFLLFRTAALRHLCNVRARKDFLGMKARRLFVLARAAEAYIVYCCTNAHSLQDTALVTSTRACILLFITYAVSSRFVAPHRRHTLGLSLVLASAYPVLMLPAVVLGSGAAPHALLAAMLALQAAAVARALWLQLAQRG